MPNFLPKAAAQALHFEEEILPNGFVVRLLHMPNYSAVHAIYTTHFGSVDRVYESDAGRIELPSGTAHFLEHKMFENEDGVDAFELFAKTGASANAYTGFQQTSYIFTATDCIEENLDILLSFVSSPHFTAQTVEKEQGIIGQEIKMYDDHAEIRCVFGLLACLYQKHPVRDDIVGTVESIAEITPQLLYDCVETFYQPGNMALCVAGNITMQQVMAAVKRAGIQERESRPLQRVFAQEKKQVQKKEHEFTMPVSMPLFALGFKEIPHDVNDTRFEVICDLLIELLCGESSKLYRRMYDDGLIQPGFGGEFGCLENCLHFIFTGESENPQEVRSQIIAEIEQMRKTGVDKEQFETCRRMMYGEAIADLESVERVAAMLAAGYYRKRSPADALAQLAALTVEDINDALQELLHEEYSAFVVVRPEQNERG